MEFLREVKNLEGKRVLVRCDFNLPLSSKGEILSAFRVEAVLPTLNYLIKKRAKLVLMSHLDRPGGKAIEKLKMDKVQNSLQNIWIYRL